MLNTGLLVRVMQQRTVAPKEQLLGVAIGRPMKRKPFTSCRFLLAILNSTNMTTPMCSFSCVT
jgi:hypothetical protein